ncbi:hypothetical protein [Chengkuizengella axinellae]|uniref:Uncharacterized protein n=1 Tax=Chengkuizengella axinellae TaxID=3064388 RepID=A0ABT9IV42_9BACL|nr:hypothetical protein [Chengkuizengella sp. 2205SS18-9]MDP5273234.1 hypothetical protein [Chengkuizengella sp. 2205SS18-9]
MGVLNWLFDKENKAIICGRVDPRIESVMTAYVALHNAKVDEVDHITDDDVIEDALKLYLRGSLHVDDENIRVKKQNVKPTYINDYRTSRGRAQARELIMHD